MAAPRQLAERLTSLRPEMRVLFLSGFSESMAAQEGLVDAGDRFLQKPFTNDALARIVRETLNQQSRPN